MQNPFRKIDFKKFKVAMFDFDGTITEKGVNTIDPAIIKEFERLLSRGFPIAICTGRQLASFKRRIKPVHDYFEERGKLDHLKNLYLLGENGAIGYYFDPAKKKYKLFYKALWPEDFPKKKFEKGLYEATKKIAVPMDHKIPIVLRAKNLNQSIDEIYKVSAQICKLTVEYIKKFPYKNIRKIIHIGNSGLGCLICHANGDKDVAIKAFGEFLAKKRGMKFGKRNRRFREIMVVGDNPQKGGNDHYFLNGTYGTAFSVSERCRAKFFKMPYLVKNETKHLLFNNKGSLFLLKHLLRK